MIDQPRTRITSFQILSVVLLVVAGAVALLAAYLPVGLLASRQSMDVVGIVAVFAMMAVLVLLVIKELGVLTILLLIVLASSAFFLLSLDPMLSRYRLVGVLATSYVLRYRTQMKKHERKLSRLIFVGAGYLYGWAVRGISSSVSFARDAFKIGKSAARRDK